MLAKLARATLLIAALAVVGCSESSIKDFSPKGADRQLPPKILALMKAKGMARNAPIMARIFKEEGKAEIWKQKANGRYDLVAQYDICKWSGKLGPKFTEGDRQAPEGFYTVRPAQMNPNSNYHLSFNIGYPNAYDRAHGRTGANLMVHGACSSSGCYSMNDEQIEQIYAFGRDAFRGGQTEFQIEAYPFRMTAANMARYRNDPNYPFWQMLKAGYDYFEITKVPPKVDVCEGRYVFNQTAAPGSVFNPTGACPATTQPDSLRMAYQGYQSTYEAAFTSAVTSSKSAPKPTIGGTKEAALVSEWSRARARGERVPIEPPSLNADGSVTVTGRMGRIDSPLGRKMAAIDADKAAKAQAAQQKAAAKQQAEADKAAAAAAAAKAPQQAPAEAPAVPVVQPTVTETSSVQPADDGAGTGVLSSVRKKLGNLFGG
jgi:murein L,D-transpeptidase YafK